MQRHVIRWGSAFVALCALLSGAAMLLGGLRPSSILAYASGETPDRDIVLLDLATGALLKLTRSAADEYAPSWSDAGNRLVFREYVTRRVDNLHSLNLGTFTIEHRTGLESREDSVAGAAWAATAGQPFLFTLGYGQMWMGDENGEPVPIGYGFGPTLSPDGAWVLYYADSPNDLNAEIFAYNPAGHALLNLSQHAAHDWSPAWSPDGHEFAFVSTRDGNAEIYVAPFACAQSASCGRDARRLTHSSSADLDPAWSPDGRQIAFVREDRLGSQILVMDIATGEEHTVTNGLASASSPAWKP